MTVFTNWGADFPERPPTATKPVYYPGDPDPARLPTIVWLSIVVAVSIGLFIVFNAARAFLGDPRV